MTSPDPADPKARNGLGSKVRELLARTGPRRLLLTAAPSQVQRLCVALLKELLTGDRRRGVVVCIDAPAANLSAVLRVRGVDLSRLVLYDGTGLVGPLRASGGSFGEQLLAEVGAVLEGIAAQGGGSHAGQTFDFLLIDNLSAMAAYFDRASVEELLRRLSARQGLEVYVAAPSTLAPAWLQALVPPLHPVALANGFPAAAAPAPG